MTLYVVNILAERERAQLERLVVATERIATALEGLGSAELPPEVHQAIQEQAEAAATLKTAIDQSA